MDNKMIYFKEGILGFEELKEYILLEQENSKFYYLQSVQEEQICFVIINPYDFISDYHPKVNEHYFEKLGGGATEDFAVYTIVKLASVKEDITVNLQAPILIHIEKREGTQAIIEDRAYDRQTKLVDLIKERG